MDAFQYFMPTKMFFGENCIVENWAAWRKLGKKALIMTGKHSAKANGSLEDVITALTKCNKTYVVFNEVEENPSLETVMKAADLGKEEKVDFLVAIGGGSPMDAAKSTSILIENPGMDPMDLYSENKTLSYLPLIAIPTTAGTGSEVTPYSILTLHAKETKASIKQRVFPDFAFLDAKYMMGLSPKVTANTAIDALSHLIESYMSTRSNFLSERLVESGLMIFRDCMDALQKQEYSLEIREKLLLTSSIGGMVISQTSTSLPHLLGYNLTYHKNIPHGRANGLVMKAYLELIPDQEKVTKMLSFMGLSSLQEMQAFFDAVLKSDEVFTDKELRQYAEFSGNDSYKLTSFPGKVTVDDLYQIYKKSLVVQ